MAHRGPFRRPALSRRRFLELSALSTAVACREPREPILPWVEQPETLVQGQPRLWATGHVMDGFCDGILVETHDGRPTKVEGNPDHPNSRGASDAFAQGLVWSLYGPDRSRAILGEDIPRSWNSFTAALREQAGRGTVHILTPTTTSPTLIRQLRALEATGRVAWYTWDPIDRQQQVRGTELAFGRPLHTRLDVAAARSIVALDAPFLEQGPGWLANARGFAEHRGNVPSPNRLVAVSPSPSATTASADHHLVRSATGVQRLALGLAHRLGLPVPTAQEDPDDAAILDALAQDLREAGREGLIAMGPHLPAPLHALGHATNGALGALGTTVLLHEPIAHQGRSLAELLAAMEADQVESLVVADRNPAWASLPDGAFAAALGRVPFSVHLGVEQNETSALTTWHVPARHPLERWSDARAVDGTATILQPTIAPLHGGRDLHEIAAILAGELAPEAYTQVRNTWQQDRGQRDFEVLWHRALERGVVPGTEAASLDVAPPSMPDLSAELDALRDEAALEVVFRPSPRTWDGRYAHHPWLQELPTPLSRNTWGNPAWIAPALAEMLGLETGSIVRLEAGGERLELPVVVVPRMHEGTIALTLGYGRRLAGDLGSQIGVDVTPLRDPDQPWRRDGVQVQATGEVVALPIVQPRQLVPEGIEPPVRQVRQSALATHDKHHQKASLGGSRPPEHPAETEEWAMVVDLSSCIGCGVCTIACQAENAIPSVGPDEVIRGREMHWIRVDHYLQGDPDAHGHHYSSQPVPCMHCEKAPCETVCPVAATTHSVDGLNEMTYNRCIGTRYCSNNCPYKVRRFNWFDYSSQANTGRSHLQNNPEVTVRSRGVMEKCTYCVQRIRRGQQTARVEGREVGPDEVVPACAQACPTQAITFGDKSRPGRVTQLREEPHHYALLEELNTRPRTTYLAEVTNPLEALEEAIGEGRIDAGETAHG